MMFAEQIRIIRQKLFMTQEALATELEVALTTVNRWETGKSKPNLMTMKKIKTFCQENKVNYDSLEESWLSMDGHALLQHEENKENEPARCEN